MRLDAATVLHRAANAALTVPTPGSNQFIYANTVYADPQGVPSHGTAREWIGVNSWQGIAQWNPCIFKNDPGCWAGITPLGELPFSYTQLESLPTSPQALLSYLDSEQHRACGILGERMSQAEREWSGVYTILNNVPVLPPRFGAALFDAAARVPGVKVIKNVTTAAGQPGIAVARTVHIKGSADLAAQAELIFSPRSYRYTGNVVDGTTSALTMTKFTNSYPHHSRPGFGKAVPACIGQVGAAGS